jgi:ATP synthase subunit D
VSSKTDNVAGVKLPVFRQYETGRESADNIGLAAGGRKIAVCREKFGDYLRALIKVASLQTSFIAMDEALKITNRRVNALENVTIPKIMAIINEINRELDELEREDFTRLKVVKRKKEEAIKQEEKLRVAMALEEAQLVAAAVPVPTKELSKMAVSEVSPTVTDTAAKKDKKKKNKNKEKDSSNTANAATVFDDMDDSDVVFK